jgi:mercuric ion transport protein
MPCAPATEAWRLLRILFLWIRTLSAGSGTKRPLLFATTADRTMGPTPRSVVTMATQPPMARAQLTDAAGAFGAIIAALCCAGTPVIVAALSATGLLALRKDAILWPIMLVSLLMAMWGYWRGYRSHNALAPLIVGGVGAASLAPGVLVVHGFPAMEMIYGGAILLVAATGWNIVARRQCSSGVDDGSLAREA